MVALSDNPMTWVMAGDSITQAVHLTHGAPNAAGHLRMAHHTLRILGLGEFTEL
ncbi:hypothetical protein [Kitasatospora sp. NPDC058190]|uniref:hypothetical protein n=1 Tax=Kitasatospora sp. NPDC058190 TaxID=3346371 RepID=UPI0036DBC117